VEAARQNSGKKAKTICCQLAGGSLTLLLEFKDNIRCIS
jgi:hypothetical protein